jgi:hypothetical protein
MRRRGLRTRRVIALGAAVLILPAIIAGGAAAVVGHEPQDADGVQVIRLVERLADQPVFDDRGAPGPSVGDRLIFSADLFDHQDHNVGRDGADCVVVRIGRSRPPAAEQVVQCMVTVQLAVGQITFQGLAQGTENRFAVTGGTGTYRRARGEAQIIDRVPLSEADVTIKVMRSNGCPSANRT